MSNAITSNPTFYDVDKAREWAARSNRCFASSSPKSFSFLVLYMSEPNLKIIEAIFQSRLKIDWAKNHIKAVEQIVDGIVANNTDVITINNDTQLATVTIGVHNFIPANLVLHLGDAIHGLNSVMDFLWSGLARACNSDLASKITFPRDEMRKNLETRFNNPKGYDATINKNFPQAKSFVLDIVKPYKGSDMSLIWTLNKLDNINKHRMLIIATHIISFDRSFALVGSDGGRFSHGADVTINTQGYPLTVRLTSPAKIENNPKATVAVVFGEPDYFTSEPILETLSNLTGAVSEVINSFEQIFL